MRRSGGKRLTPLNALSRRPAGGGCGQPDLLCACLGGGDLPQAPARRSRVGGRGPPLTPALSAVCSSTLSASPTSTAGYSVGAGVCVIIVFVVDSLLDSLRLYELLPRDFPGTDDLRIRYEVLSAWGAAGLDLIPHLRVPRKEEGDLGNQASQTMLSDVAMVQ